MGRSVFAPGSNRRALWGFGTASAAAIALGVAACATSPEMPVAPEEAGPSLLTADVPDAGGDVDSGTPQCPSNDCLPFHLDCNGDAGDGCEANIRSDIDNCGGCGIQCVVDGGVAPPFTRPACVDGKC